MDFSSPVYRGARDRKDASPGHQVTVIVTTSHPVDR